MTRPAPPAEETEVSPVRVPKPLLAASLMVLAAAVSVACFAQVV
ncbi:hypothetical protein ACFW3D_38820 [Streptomyces sp. NPDC058864]